LEHGITPQTIQKKVLAVLEATKVSEDSPAYETKKEMKKMTGQERAQVIARLEMEMKQAAKELNFEQAAELRDLILELKVEGV
jgi:excinuclease ABC subunit B